MDEVFHSVARRYDLMNDLMSGGLHRVWKDALVTAANPPQAEHAFALLDLAGGTGDVAFRVVESGGAGTRVTVCDINADMLTVGAERALERGLDDRVSFEQGNAEELPYPDRSFDCVTIAFGIRNVPRIERALGRSLSRAQARRPFPLPGILGGGRAGLRCALRDVFVQRHPGASATRSPATARPISIWSNRSASFPSRRRFAAMMEAAGFRRVSFTPITGGVVALHSGWKL